MMIGFRFPAIGLLFGLSWLQGSVSTLLPYRKVVKIFFNPSLFVLRQPCLGKIIFLLKCLFIYVGGIYWYAMDINFSLFLLCNGDISLGILLVRFLFILCCT